MRAETTIGFNQNTFGKRLAVATLLATVLATGLAQRATADCVPLPADAAGWWQGESNLLDVLDLDTGVAHGTVSYGEGMVGKAFVLDGNNSYISFPASPNLNIGAGGSFTVECWINPTNVNSDRPLVEWNQSGNFGVHLWISQPLPFGNGPGCIYANVEDIFGNSHPLTTGGSLVSVDNFQHVALTYDTNSGLARIYYNGSIAAEEYFGAFIPRTSYPLFLGARPAGQPNVTFPGRMDEVTLYKRALSPEEIFAIANASSAGKCTSSPPTIVSQPSSQTVPAGTALSWNVSAAGIPPFGYQWQFNNSDLPGATNSSYSFASIQISNSGTYAVIVSNIFGATPSSDFVITAYVPACTPPQAGLVSWWQGQGNTQDVSGLNPLGAQAAVAYAPGEVGTAFLLNGSTAYLKAGPSASLNVGTNGTGFTIDCWFKPADLGQRPIFEWNGPSFGVHLWISEPAPTGSGPGCLYANIRDTDGEDHLIATPAGLVSTNVFQHVALTYDPSIGVGRIYYNGVITAEENLGAFIPQTSFPLYIGARVSGAPSGRFMGIIDEATLYQRSLSTTEIQSIVASATTGLCDVAPGVILPPADVLVTPSNTVAFSVQASGTQPIYYQWLFNASALNGNTNSTLTVTNVQPSNAGSYSVVISNSAGAVTSSPGLLKLKGFFAFGNGQPLTNAAYTFGYSVTIQLQNFYTNGGFMFYTLDGSTPTFSSPQYTGPFNVIHDSTLRVLAISPDFQSITGDPIGLYIVPEVHLSASAAGGGTVSKTPNSANYLSNAVVTVTATPNAGWTFLEWLGDASGTNATTTVLLNRDKSVQAVFGSSLSVIPTGPGALSLNPPGGVYPYGTAVQVSAVPQPGNFFVTWGAPFTGHANPLTLPMTNANQTVTALFGGLAGGQMSLVVVPVGNGAITANPDNNTYTTGQVVTLSATPATNHSFLGWSGGATGTNNPLSVTVSSNSVIYANFSTDNQLVISLPPGGSSQGAILDLWGQFGATYRLEASSNLVNWSSLYTLTNRAGVLHYIDSASTNLDQRFYRGLQLQ